MPLRNSKATDQLTVRLSPDDKQKISQLAAENSMTITAFLIEKTTGAPPSYGHAGPGMGPLYEYYRRRRYGA